MIGAIEAGDSSANTATLDRIKPGEHCQAAADPEGWGVMLFVVEGELTLEVETDTILIQHDGYLLDSTQPHAFANRSDQIVRFFRCTAW